MNGLTRRRLLETSLVALATGCASFRQGSPFYATVTDALGKTPGGEVTRAYADALPYASMRVWLNGRGKNLFLLSDSDGAKNFSWYGPSNNGMTTFGPYVTRLIGADVELRRTLFSGRWSTDLRRMDGVTAARTLSLVSEDKLPAEIEFISRFRSAGTEHIDVFGRQLDLLRIDEKVTSGGHPRHLNSYWIAPDNGLCWKSRQLALPTLPPINIEMIKFPADA